MKRRVWMLGLGALAAIVIGCIPYGSSGEIGQAYAPSGTCSGVSRCCVCPNAGACSGSCTDPDSWQEAVEHASCVSNVCDTILFDGDLSVFYPANGTPLGGTVTLPTGQDATHRIKLMREGTDRPLLAGGFVCGATSAYVDVGGLNVFALDNTHAIQCDRFSGTGANTIKFIYNDINGGTDDGIHICGNVNAMEIDANKIDGGLHGHAIKVVCSNHTGDTSGCNDPEFPDELPDVCLDAPTVTLYENTITASNTNNYDYAGTRSNDGGNLLYMTGYGTSVVMDNTFGGATEGDDCVHIKHEGAAGATLTYSRNNHTAGACPGEALRINGYHAALGALVSLNHFLGSSSDGVTLDDTGNASFEQNWFNGARFRAIGTGGYDFLYNTMSGSGTYTQGSSTDCPDAVLVANNIFSGTVLDIRDGSVCDRGAVHFADVAGNLTYNSTGDAFRYCTGGSKTVCDNTTDCPGGQTCQTAAATDAGLLTTDPQLTGFHIASTSPAKDSAAAASGYTAPNQDMDNNTRPANGTRDRGVDEFVTTTTTSTSTTSTTVP